MGESLCEAVDIAAGSKVLDVAAGNGNASLAAARRGADVTCTDYVDMLLGLAQRRAEADGLHITTQVADAENLPFEDNSFDTVLSDRRRDVAPNPERSLAPSHPHCRPAARSASPTGRPGLHRPDVQDRRRAGAAAARCAVAAAVGHRRALNERLGADCTVEITRSTSCSRYRSAADFFDTFKEYYGPTEGVGRARRQRQGEARRVSCCSPTR
jgi:SAM-dependent methyltransferase